ncbi:accessory gene regulator ArgB-like protein [Dehalobacterium formicoaceticum]|uniref:accessory gene regulator ArgB-like protein n=1 Tax=Dehalobacterium formicoaceticum TaxID=51515 RepID=UPI0012F751F2|nr:accessory gene regulator B family protein [Dehalobacterium formicoaceticum]
MGYSKLSTGIASYLGQELNLDQEKETVIAYSLDNILLAITGFVLIVLVGALFGAALPAAITALAGGVLRRFSGGVHAATPIKCMLFSSLGYGLASALGFQLSQRVAPAMGFFILPFVFALIVVFLYAPVDSPAKPIHDLKLKKRLKLGSILFILLMLLLVISLESTTIKVAVTVGILIQSCTLFPVFNTH